VKKLAKNLVKTFSINSSEDEMLSYKVKYAYGKFGVFEKSTDQFIKFCNDEKNAKEYCRFLNYGGAFDGYTPKFILNSFEISNSEE
jgi:hypothetical protein